MNRRRARRWANREMRIRQARRLQERVSGGLGGRRRSSEGPALFETVGEEEKKDSKEQDADRSGGAQRPIVSGAEKALHNVGNHDAGGAADEERCEEITKG